MGYLSAMRFLLIKPHAFFAEYPPLPDYRQQLLFILPPACVFAAGMAWQQASPWWALAYLPAAYAGVALWAVILKYVLVAFGEKRSFREVLHVSACSSVPLLVGWIPHFGLPALYLLVGLLTFLGLVFHFKMHSGAALAAVALPVVVAGFGGGILSFIFLWLASLSTIFAR